jgi:hypothetical protein
VAVSEFQKRGAIHFHALVWGIPPSVVKAERHTRLVASIWGQGFTDMIETDGNSRLASYFAKYMKKAYLDPRMLKKKHTLRRGIVSVHLRKKEYCVVNMRIGRMD